MLVTRRTVRKIERIHADELAFKDKLAAMDKQAIDNLHSQAEGFSAANRTLSARLDAVCMERDILRERLDAIIAMETPNCANIGRKMARAARGDG